MCYKNCRDDDLFSRSCALHQWRERGFWKITPAPCLKATSKRQQTRYKFGGSSSQAAAAGWIDDLILNFVAELNYSVSCKADRN